MTTAITQQALAQAAEQGEGIAHLLPHQTHTLHLLGVPASAIASPLTPEQETALAHVHGLNVEEFKRACPTPEAMIEAAYDERHPPYLRLPVQHKLAEGMRHCFPDLKPAGVDSQGRGVYRLSDLANALGASEDELHDLAEQHGMQNTLNDSDVTPIH